MSRTILLILACLCMCPSVSAIVREPADTTNLDEIIVTAPVHTDVIPMQHLDGDALQRLNSHNVADAIRYFSGVQIKDYGGVGGVKTIDMRSMGSNHLGVFYDGLQLGNAQNGQIDLGKFSLDNIEQISVYNGQRSEIFQSARDYGSAGTVYLRTRRPDFRSPRRSHLSVTYRAGSFGLLNPSLRWEYRISSKVAASISAEYTHASGRYKFRYHKVFSDGTLAWDTTATRKNGDIHSYRVEAALFGRPDKGQWMAKLYYYDSEKGIPGAIVNNVWKTSQRQWDRNFFAQGTWERPLSQRYSMMVNAKYARDYMRYLNPDTTLMYINNRFYQDEAYLSVANKLELMRGWDVSTAVDWQWNHLNSTLVNFSKPTRNTLYAALATAFDCGPLRSQASLLATYVRDRWMIDNGTGLNYAKSKSKVRLTPAVFLSCRMPEPTGLTLRAFYKRVFRMPTFNDLYYTDMGNAALSPEYVTQYNFGFVETREFASTIFRRISFTADIYHNRVRDKIIAVPKGTGQYRWMMMNIGKVRITGLDVTAEGEASLPYEIHLRARLSYTWQRALDYTDPTDNLDAAGTYRGQIAYIPRHSGSATGSIDWRWLNLNYSFIYVGERYENSSNILQNRVQPWYTHDMSIGGNFKIHRTAYRVDLEINNLFNQQYEVIANYPMPGRNFKIILRVDL